MVLSSLIYWKNKKLKENQGVINRLESKSERIGIKSDW